MASNLSILLLLLQIGVFGVFFGHGCLAVCGNRQWLSFMRAGGIYSEKLAFPLMRFIGLIDISYAFIALYSPFLHPILHAYGFTWAFATAAIRPLSGESIFGFIERAGNWTPSLVLLYLNCINSTTGDDHTDFYCWLKCSAGALAAGFVVCVILRYTKLFDCKESNKPKCH